MEEFGKGEKEGIFFSFKILIIYASQCIPRNSS
jgi:hypothetical protein